jgi:Asp-tRNA(Asn)/Glu-tRNA(Gln) amidotransferase A subunit family amidase
MNLIKISAVNALEMMKRGELTSEEYVNAFLEHIKARESEVGAWIFLDPELALEQARHADKRWKDKTPGILNGLPIGIKDIIDTKDMPTENGSLIHKGRRPSEDAHLVKLLRDAGAVIMGKCVTTEFALSAPGKTKNPKDLECTPGGSSSGSAAAVSDYMIPVAIGSQTGGSVLRPASFTGILGLKPTFGTISRSGMSPISERLDHPGIYANSTDDIKLVASVILSYDKKDLDMDSNYNFKTKSKLKSPLKFAFVKGPVWGAGDEDMKEAIQKYVNDSYLDVTSIELGDDFIEAAKCHEIIMNGSISKSLANYYETDKPKLHPFTLS